MNIHRSGFGKVLSLFLAYFLVATHLLSSCGGGGSDSGTSGGTQPPGAPTLSTSSAVPGEFITIYDTSITPESAVSVDFEWANNFSITCNKTDTKNGSVTVPVPAYYDTTTGAFTGGTVKVFLNGTEANKTLNIENLPSLEGIQGGEVLILFAQSAIDQYEELLIDIEQMVIDSGWQLDDTEVVFTIYDRLAFLDDLILQIQSTGELEVNLATGSVTLTATELKKMDRLLVAHLDGMVKELEARGIPAPSASEFGVSANPGDIKNLNDIKNEINHIVDQVKRGIEGGGVLLAAMSLLVLVAGSIAGGPIGGIAAAAGIALVYIGIAYDWGTSAVFVKMSNGVNEIFNEAKRISFDAGTKVATSLLRVFTEFGSNVDFVKLWQDINKVASGMQDFITLVTSAIKAKCDKSKESQAHVSYENQALVSPAYTMEEFCKKIEESLTVTLSGSPDSLDVDENGTWSVNISGGLPPYRVDFDWGDGNSKNVTATGASASMIHSYDSSGSYQVTITVSDELKNSKQIQTTVNVSGNLELTLSSAPNSLDVDELGTWSVSISGGNPPYLVTFDWGDGKTGGVPTTGTSAEGSHSYDSTGTYTVSITVSDDDNNSQTADATVTVSSNLEVTISAVPSSLAVAESGTWSVSITGGVSPFILTFDWGDGKSDVVSATDWSADASHSYDSPGTYTVSITVTDDEGASSSTNGAVSVSGGLTVTLTVAPGSLQVDETGSWTATVTGGVMPLSATFLWGDGSSSSASSSTSTITETYSYSTEGNYIVTINVTDNEGTTGQTSGAVTITADQQTEPSLAGTWDVRHDSLCNGEFIHDEVWVFYDDNTWEKIQHASCGWEGAWDLQGNFLSMATNVEQCYYTATVNESYTYMTGDGYFQQWHDCWEATKR